MSGLGQIISLSTSVEPVNGPGSILSGRVGSRSISENFSCAAVFKVSLTKFEQEEEDYPKIRKWVPIRTQRKRRKIALVPPLPRLTSILTIGISLVFFSLFTYLPLEFSLISSTASCCLFRDERFSNEEHYEWFKDYSHFRHLIQAHIKPNSSVPFLSLSLLLYIIFLGALIGIACVEFTNF